MIFALIFMSPIKVIKATAEDLEQILSIAQSLDLDVEFISWKDFVVVRKSGRVIGIGRLRKYETCTEIATVGVVEPERHQGVGTAIMRSLMAAVPKEVFVVNVIPSFFSRLGFVRVSEYPVVLKKKVEFCKLYNFTEEQIFIMKYVHG